MARPRSVTAQSANRRARNCILAYTLIHRRTHIMVTLPVLHFNDVYRVQPFKPAPSAEGTIDVTQWAAMLDDIRDSWAERPDGKREGLVLFSGDVFSPSTESSVTRGSHMVRRTQLSGLSSGLTLCSEG